MIKLIFSVIECAEDVITSAMRVIEEAYRSLQGEREQQHVLNAASDLNQVLDLFYFIHLKIVYF